MIALLFLSLAVLGAVAFFQPGGTDFLRVSVVTLYLHTVTVLEVLTVLTVLMIMAACRGAIALSGAGVLTLWSATTFRFVQLDTMTTVALAGFVIILGGVAHAVTSWAKH